MKILSTRSKEAIKTGLAMAISYGIALQLGWDKSSWAGIAMAMVSLSTAGQSLNKGAIQLEVLSRVRSGTDHLDFYRPFETKFEQIMQHIQGGRNTNGLIHRLSRV